MKWQGKSARAQAVHIQAPPFQEMIMDVERIKEGKLLFRGKLEQTLFQAYLAHSCKLSQQLCLFSGLGVFTPEAWMFCPVKSILSRALRHRVSICNISDSEDEKLLFLARGDSSQCS